MWRRRRYKYKDIEKQLDILKDALEKAKKIVKEGKSFIKSTEDEINYLEEVRKAREVVQKYDNLKSKKAPD